MSAFGYNFRITCQTSVTVPAWNLMNVGSELRASHLLNINLTTELHPNSAVPQFFSPALNLQPVCRSKCPNLFPQSCETSVNSWVFSEPQSGKCLHRRLWRPQPLFLFFFLQEHSSVLSCISPKHCHFLASFNWEAVYHGEPWCLCTLPWARIGPPAPSEL